MIFQSGKFAKLATSIPAKDIRRADRSRCRDKNRGRPDRPDSLPLRSRLGGWNRDLAQNAPGPAARIAGRIDRAARSGFAEHQAMRIDDEPAQVCFLHDRFEPGA